MSWHMLCDTFDKVQDRTYGQEKGYRFGAQEDKGRLNLGDFLVLLCLGSEKP